jgi:hypothetical protein
MIGVVLRRQDFRHEGLEATLNRPTAATLEVLPVVEEMYRRVFQEGVDYRATLICLGHLEDDGAEQFDLFEDRVRIEKLRRATAAIDAVNTRYGKQTVRSATSLCLADQPAMTRDDAPERRRTQHLRGETRHQRLAIPRMTVQV